MAGSTLPYGGKLQPVSNRKRKRRPPTRPRQEVERRTDLSVVPAAAIMDVVESGAVDTHLRPVGAAIRERQRQLVRKPEVDAAARFAVGDPVRLGPTVRPKYLRGATATVTGWAHKNVLVRLDHPIGRYSADTEISVSPLGIGRDIA